MVAQSIGFENVKHTVFRCIIIYISSSSKLLYHSFGLIFIHLSWETSFELLFFLLFLFLLVLPALFSYKYSTIPPFNQSKVSNQMMSKMKMLKSIALISVFLLLFNQSLSSEGTHGSTWRRREEIFRSRPHGTKTIGNMRISNGENSTVENDFENLFHTKETNQKTVRCRSKKKKINCISGKGSSLPSCENHFAYFLQK